MRTALGLVLAALIGAVATAGEFRPGDRPQHGYGRYRVSIAIVEGVDDASMLARQLSGTFGGKVESISEAGAVVRMTERSARMLSEHPRVLVVEEIVADNGSETWTTGTYGYDGAGNIKSIDTTKFTYDAFGRLTKGGSGGGHHQSYTYDNYGNILTVTTDGNTSTQLKLGVNPATNRMSQTTSPYNVWGQYDAAGRMTSYQSTQTFVYDALDMIKESTVNGTRRLYLYTPKNERLAAITVSSSGQEIYSTWTVRETSGQVIRRFTRTGGTWRWDQDYIHRDGQLLASELPNSVRRYFHLDHLGTPRVITNGNGTRVALHNYYPFGLEETSPLQDNEAMKFTGHERDAATLDHMHARSYLPGVGRFLSVDPTFASVALSLPQSWNRYSYVGNNPLLFNDPLGAIVEFANKLAENYYKSYMSSLDPNSEDYKNAKQLEASDITYVLTVGGMQGSAEGELGFDGKKVILHLDSGGPMQDASMNSRIAHEIQHGVQVDNGALGFRKGPDGKWSPIFTDIYDEVQAWHAQARQASGFDFIRGNLKDFMNAKNDKERAELLSLRGYSQYQGRLDKRSGAPWPENTAPGTVMRSSVLFYRVPPIHWFLLRP